MSENKEVHTSDYIDGNAVRKIEKKTKQQGRVSAKVRRKRARARQINAAYVWFLAAASVCTLFLCVHYLQLKATVKTQNSRLASLETELNSITAENDALYEKAISSVDLAHIKDVAINELGMNYASESQIVFFSIEGKSYFRQYQDVPDTK